MKDVFIAAPGFSCYKVLQHVVSLSTFLANTTLSRKMNKMKAESLTSIPISCPPLNSATCSCFVKNWESVDKIINPKIPAEASWSETSLGTQRGSTPEVIWKRYFLSHTCTHIHTFPSFSSPTELPPIPPTLFYSLSTCISKNKQTNKKPSRAESPTLYKIVAIYSQHLGLAAHTTGFTYVHILLQ